MPDSASGDLREGVVREPVRGLDDSLRGYVVLDTDRLGHTEFSITIDTTSFLDPYEARAFASALHAVADRASSLLAQQRVRARREGVPDV